MYTVRKLKIGKTLQLDALTSASGELYSQTLVSFWRTVRKKNLWLKPSSLMRWHNSKEMHAHSADAVVQSFCTSLKSWRKRRKTDPEARPPKKRRRFFKVQWKNSAIRLKDGKLLLSNGKGNLPVSIDWKWQIPILVEIGWDGQQYELRAVYDVKQEIQAIGNKVAGVDLGEIHMAVSHDGENCHILNGRLLRSKRQYQNKVKAKLSAITDTKKKGSNRWKKAIKSKKKQLRRLNNQINDILHKQTTALISTLYEEGVQKLVIGDIRDIRKDLDYGKKANQKLHQMISGKTRWMLSYKAERFGMSIDLQEESYTSQECPACGRRHKPSGREYICRCGFRYHRDGVGGFNIRKKYLGSGPVVGVMAPPTGIRFVPNARVARSASILREAAGF